MMKFERPPQPDFLRENYKQWGREHKARRMDNPTSSFQWRTYAGQPVNQLVLAALEPVAKQHCAFCDGYPLGPFARQTLEHFRPISRYPQLCYAWPNLFICCDQCQAAKRDSFDKKLLKPDAADYSFQRYFVINYKTGEIEPNPGATAIEQQRAQFTIALYGLNEHGRPQSRINESRKYQGLLEKGYTLDDFSYRFFLE